MPSTIVIRLNKAPLLAGLLLKHVDRLVDDLAQTIVEQSQTNLYPGHGYDTGALHDSFGIERIGRHIAFVHAQASYAAFVEFGTIHMPAIPFMRPGILAAAPLAIGRFVQNFGHDLAA